MCSDCNCSTFKTNADFLQKERRIIFDGEEAYLIRSKPFPVIRTKKDTVITGDLHNRFEYVE